MKITHEILYHYTSLGTLQAILSTGCLRFTDFRYLNDETEFRLAISPSTPFGQALQERLLSCPFSTRQAPTNKDEEHRFLSDYRKFLDDVEFLGVSCFSADKDSLSQWRAYCPSASGVAVGFNSRRLATFAGLHQISLVPCDYIDSEDRSTFSHLIDTLHTDLLDWRDRDSSSDYYVQRLAKDFGALKHRTFHSEKEYRLICPALTQSRRRIETDAGRSLDMTINFRQGSHCLIPFIDIPTYTKDSETAQLQKPTLLETIDELVLGPTVRPELSHRSVSMLLARHDMSHVRISTTTAPLRYM